jgi:hypothetical protein
LINRINRITAAVDQDLDQAGHQRPKLKSGEWETLDLAGMVNKFGVYYLPYRRLRIAAVTDALAYLVTRVLDIEEDSAGFFAVRVIVRVWREQMYPDYHRAATESTTDKTLKPVTPALRLCLLASSFELHPSQSRRALQAQRLPPG